MGRRKNKMSFRDAMSMVDDDMPDGAFFAMAHEIAGMEYGEGFDELAAESQREDQGYDAEWVVNEIRKKLPAAKIEVFNKGYHIKVNGHMNLYMPRKKFYDSTTKKKGWGIKEMCQLLETK